MILLLSILSIVSIGTSKVITPATLLALQASVVIDSIPELPDDSLLAATVINRLRFGCGEYDSDILDVNDREHLLGRSFGKGRYRTSKRVSHDERYHILAWQKTRVAKKYLFNNEELILYNVLVWASYEDSAGNSEWVLMIVTKDEQLEGYVSWKLACDYDSGPLQRFSKPPTNEDVYQFLSVQSKIETHLFVENATKVTEQYGVPLQFVAGDVREETWEAIIGEKPTKFFPGEK